MPSGGSADSDFKKLYDEYLTPAQLLVDYPDKCSTADTRGCDNNGTFTPGFLFSGGYASTGAGPIAQYGSYLSRTARSVGLVYNFYINESTVGAYSNSNKYFGRPVRCLAN